MKHLLFGILLVGLVSASQAAEKNIVLIVADDLGFQLGCYGDPVAQTPNLDKLAADGTRFLNAFCTTASCSASRSVILTGLQNHANGQFGHEHPPANFHTYESIRSLPVLLGDRGYRTCSIGKFHVQPKSVYDFDVFANQDTMGARSTVQMAENAREFITAAKEEAQRRPFFIYYCTSDPHRAGKGFANDRSYPGVEPVKYDPAEIEVPDYLPNQPEVREELAEYYEAVSRVDQGVGRLMQVLKDTGNWDNTMVLFLSDNGPPFPGSKTTLYDSGMHLPLIVRSPDQMKRGVVTQAMVTWADLVPTILEFTGAQAPDYPLHGQSFLGTLDGSDLEDRTEIYASHTFHEITMYYPMRVIRTPKYKYILNLAHQLPYPFASDLFASPTWQGVLKRGDKTLGTRQVDSFLQRPRHELYDLEQDPSEAKNLAEDPRYTEILSDLQQKLKRWQQQTDDPWLVKYRYE